MKQRISKLLTIATTTLTLALASCVVDVKNPVVFGPGEGESVTISFNPHIDGVNPPATRATRAFPDQGQLDPGGGEQGSDAVGKEPEDVEIVDLRVLLYKSSTGQFVDEDQATVDAPGEPVELELVTGVYDVVLIANASSDTGLAPAGRLNAVFGTVGNYNNLNKVKNALLDSRAFEEDDTPIPMFALVRNVHIMLDGSVEIDGAEAQNTHINPWAPILKRVGVRISMEIELTPYQYIDWNAAGRTIEISKIPDRAWLWDSGKSNGDPDQREADARVYTASPADAPAPGYDGYTEYVAPEPAQGTDPAVEEHYLVRFDRIIVPELVFDDTDDAELAAVLSMDMDNDLVVSGRISGPNPDSSADGFTLPRNLWLHLDVSIAGSRLEVIPKVIPWNNEAAGGPFLDKDWLRARGPVYIAGVWPQTFDAVTSLDNVSLLMENGTPKIEYLQGDGWLIVEPAATTTPGNENGVDTQTRTITVRANADNTGKYRRAKVWVVATDETTGKKIEKWVEVIHTSGVPVPAGVIGYVAEGPEFGRLTLRGSREYATPVYDGRPVFSDAALEMFPDQGGLESVTVYAAYFKWGSLVATSSELTDNVFDADDIVAAPEDFNNIGYPVPALEAVRNVVQNIWARVPVRSGSDALANSWKSEPVEGLGDPCAYYFKDWRMPVGGAEDRSTEADGWNNGTFGTARAGGGGQPVAARGVPFAAGDLGPGVPAGRRAGNGTSAYPADWSMFLPYAGGRSGGVQGSNGIYWSSTPSTDTHGYHLGVQPDTAYPAHEQVYTNAYNVRCIDTDPPKPNDKVYAAPGMVGIKKSAYDWLTEQRAGARGGDWIPRTAADWSSYTASNGQPLTIKGSSTYAGTWVETNIANNGAEFKDTPYQGLETEPVYTLYFKWGSMVAMIGGGSTSTGGDTWSIDDVVWVNPGFNVTIDAVINHARDDGYYGGFKQAPYDATNFDQSPGNNDFNFGDDATARANGWGDICEEITDGSWRIPTGRPFATTETYMGVNNTTGTTYPFGDYRGISDRTWAESRSTTYKGVTYWRDASGPATGVTFDGVYSLATHVPIGLSGTQGQAVSDNQDFFMPAAGLRNVNGLVNNQGTFGYYWSSSAYGSDGYSMIFYNSRVSQSGDSSYPNGMSIRCVVAPPPSPPATTINNPTVPGNKNWVSYHSLNTAANNNPTYGEAYRAMYPRTVTVNVTANGLWEIGNIEVYDAGGVLLINETAAVNAAPENLVSPLTGGDGTTGVVVTPPVIDGVRRYAITFVSTNGTASRTTDVWWLWGGENHILYIDNGVLKQGRWMEDFSDYNQIMFFKPGSVIGFNEYADNDLPGGDNLFLTNDIFFNPSNFVLVPLNGPGNSGKNENTFRTVPYYNGDYNGDYSVPLYSSEYHNAESVLAGRGDPCQLVGLTGEQIREALNEGVDAFERLLESRDNQYKGWRLPNKRESSYFGGGSKMTRTAENHEYPASSGWDEAGNVSRFPLLDTNGIMPVLEGWGMPLIGYHNEGSNILGRGRNGEYFTGTPSTNSFIYGFSTSNWWQYAISPSRGAVRTSGGWAGLIMPNQGYGVRCVRPE